jgi:RNA polymerase sigma-70 factor (ECF subfamily)
MEIWRMTDTPAPGPGRHGLPQQTSLTLLERARANDRDAWSRVVSLYEPMVRLWCGRAGLSAEDAEDVSQEVLASAAAGLAGFRRDRPGDTFRGWLRTITRNAVATYCRRHAGRARAEGGSAAWQRLQEVADPLAGPDAEETAEVNRLYLRALEQVRCEFEERTWRAFWLTLIDGRSPALLVGELGMSAPAIRQAKSRVLRRLKLEMGDLLD